MSLLNDIDHCFKTTLKNQHRLELSTLRLLKTALKNRQIQERRSLTEAEVVGVITSQVKQRRDSIEEFRRAGRNDLAQQEEEELRFLLSFLPKQLTPTEIRRELESIISEIKAVGPGDLGRVMKAAMPKMAGRADGKAINLVAKELLSGD